ncbi:UNVERIFIED_CONTAM: hypothetical protein Slati_4543600 [Sesamum latifolium]|uniref:Uncharacterized protein n=1 Tax=Sesamum latifolium TaxID=2727402 RepID=A0AAW2SFV1_9LAMI
MDRRRAPPRGPVGSCQTQCTSYPFLGTSGHPLQKVLHAPLLRCLSTEEGVHVLQEIHSGCVELILAHGLWPIKPYEQDTSGLP